MTRPEAPARAPQDGMRLEVRGLERALGGRPVLRGLDLDLAPGTIGCLLGPSGCGKTTALRTIAGFEDVDAGRVLGDGEVLSSPGRAVPPERRRIGMVFQDHALFPHLDVLGNVAFGLAGRPAAERRTRALELLDAVGLAGLERRRPHELSGGQQQRVALARALAPGPRLLLLDEPLASLDAELRQRLGAELRAVLKRYGTTALLVTHDQQEAFAIADEVGVLRDGVLQQWATPYDLYHRPATRFVAEFVGLGAFVRGALGADGTISTVLGPVRGASGRISVDGGTHARSVPQEVDLLLRPDDVVHDDASALRAEVLRRSFRGADFLYALRLPDGTTVLSLVPSHHDHRVGERIGVRLDLDHVIAFSRPVEPGASAAGTAARPPAR
jgi:iron(III) transport system ATP-binding protein